MSGLQAAIRLRPWRFASYSATSTFTSASSAETVCSLSASKPADAVSAYFWEAWGNGSLLDAGDEVGCGSERVFSRGARENHCVLVAPQAREHVGASQPRGQHLADVLDDRVPQRVPERIVEVLEVIKVEHDQRRAIAVAAAERHLPLKLALEAPAVEQVGQRVVLGEVNEALLEQLALSDVLDLRDEVLG